jgi:hypothetical protein
MILPYVGRDGMTSQLEVCSTLNSALQVSFVRTHVPSCTLPQNLAGASPLRLDKGDTGGGGINLGISRGWLRGN